ncbi:hypothetical protein GPECTOR_13g722 [Gonium pectorale]|uniref:Orn/Lys/Arg decarboxylases family 1 pyridoxal-P attachment site domain-containing protein n=1 Tax=Gonium pectorale TaxID=33097 RepID=A0A150GN83_GONPE|nr:hypothetical protein GPECTOR_13g722 [Gonium pectorale]|eukprot:KXZ51235.1 hypothetical protein GPECTOR_13g722 [Gonium pectorale]
MHIDPLNPPARVPWWRDLPVNLKLPTTRLDFLSSPSGVIREAQELAAEAFGADHTWFLVNGCSVGIHAAVVAATAGAADRAPPGGHGAAADHPRPGPAPAGVGVGVARGLQSTPGGIGEESGALGERGGGGGPRAPDVLLVARNCHLSAFSAMVLAGCEPYWLQPELDPRVGMAHCVTASAIAAALAAVAAAGRSAVGVLVVSPTYFGAVADIAGIAAACHAHGVPLLVDEAHGGHFAFLPPGVTAASQAEEAAAQPPPSALSCGADVVIQSTHKVLGAMTQAAMLHVRGGRVSPSRISRALQTLQSSSPSYLLMASLDAARAQAAAGGAYDEPTAAAQVVREAVTRCRFVQLLDDRTAGSRSSVHSWDPLRLTLLVDRLDPAGLPDGGFGAAEWLERTHGLVPELATAKTVVLALGPGSTLQHARVAAAAVQELDRRFAPAADASGSAASRGGADGEPERVGDAAAAAPTSVGTTAAAPLEVAEVVMIPRDAFLAASCSVPADEAVGCISAELLCPYPPGVPALFPGERITAAALRLLRGTLAAGGAITGARDGSLARLEVVVAGQGGRPRA